MALWLRCSSTCGILPDQGSNPWLPQWQEDSLPLSHQGSPLPCGLWLGGKARTVCEKAQSEEPIKGHEWEDRCGWSVEGWERWGWRICQRPPTRALWNSERNIMGTMKALAIVTLSTLQLRKVFPSCCVGEKPPQVSVPIATSPETKMLPLRAPFSVPSTCYTMLGGPDIILHSHASPWFAPIGTETLQELELQWKERSAMDRLLRRLEQTAQALECFLAGRVRSNCLADRGQETRGFGSSRRFICISLYLRLRKQSLLYQRIGWGGS